MVHSSSTAISASASQVADVISNKRYRTVYQPLVNLKTREVFAYEALVRPEVFPSPPAFFEAAVDACLVGQLGRALRADAIANCQNHPLFLNIHPNELNEPYLVQPDDPIFQHTEDVYVELTESVPLSHFQLCLHMLSEIRGKGVYLVVDDLGAGYSNLKYIADLHPRIVKIDRLLTAGMKIGSRMHRLVKHIVAMCKEMGALVVCEGIETDDELHAVIEAGAHYGQGYLLARPAFPPPAVTWPAAVAPQHHHP